ncbi:hypothetical protein H9L39_01286 [Fusarium oxysporum f. sp. albedinis]|nr:hypothetical protein H9L39_01286 [Fusarium oxysporum f. sp. albedinis]
MRSLARAHDAKALSILRDHDLGFLLVLFVYLLAIQWTRLPVERVISCYKLKRYLNKEFFVLHIHPFRDELFFLVYNRRSCVMSDLTINDRESIGLSRNM